MRKSIFSGWLGIFSRKDFKSNAVDDASDRNVDIMADMTATSICFAPSVNMLFATDGTVKACCHNSENSLGRYPDQTIREIWNSQEAMHFRKKLGQNQFLSGCETCVSDYRSGNLDQMPAQYFGTLPRRNEYPRMMEFLLSNTCNLECIMCTGELSSSIRKNREKLPPIISPYDSEFLNQLEEFIPYLTETRFSGAGEAFSVDMNYSVWQMLIDTNPDCLIQIQTNGTILNARVKDFLDRGNFKIGVSLDSLQKSRYEQIRYGASFEQVMRNIEYFSAYSRMNKKSLSISMCVMRDNWEEMPAFVEFCNKLDAHITFHKVWAPMKYALHTLSESELRTIHSFLCSFQFPSESIAERKNKRHYEYFVSVIKTWTEEAKDKEQWKSDIKALTTLGLLIKAKSRLRSYIWGQEMLEMDKESLIAICEKKIDEVDSMWGDPVLRRESLIRLCLARESDIIASLKEYSVQRLFEMSVSTSDFHS